MSSPAAFSWSLFQAICPVGAGAAPAGAQRRISIAAMSPKARNFVIGVTCQVESQMKFVRALVFPLRSPRKQRGARRGGPLFTVQPLAAYYFFWNTATLRTSRAVGHQSHMASVLPFITKLLLNLFC